MFTYGSSESLVDFLHVDNMVQVHVFAANALTADKNYIAVRSLIRVVHTTHTNTHSYRFNGYILGEPG